LPCDAKSPPRSKNPARPRCRPGVFPQSSESCPLQKLPSRPTQEHLHAALRSSFFKIFGLPDEEFPAFPSFKDAKSFTLRQAELRDGLRRTSYAISVDETRYVLNGILFSFKDNKLTLVATDGRRLALFDSDLEFPHSHERDFIVPTKAVTELQRLLDEEGDMQISVGENLVSFELNGSQLVSKLVEGNYPN
jgi:DNA polymerase sliding clamp subunit (PCNA homolog)